jgi:uncharacterized protein
MPIGRVEPETRQVEEAWGGGRFDISNDGLTVTLYRLIIKDASIFSKDVLIAVLKQEGIVFGIDQDAITKICREAQRRESWTGQRIVARGNPAEGVVRWRFPLLEKLVGNFELKDGLRWAEEAVLDFDALALTLALPATTPDALPDTTVVPLAAGQCIARVETCESILGMDVFGAPLSPDNPASIDAGMGVVFEQEDRVLLAGHFGYLHIENNRVSVLSPVVLTNDAMRAFYIHFPQSGPPVLPDVPEIEALFREIGGQIDLDQADIERLLQRLHEKPDTGAVVLIASGSQPALGRDARVTYQVDVNLLPGVIREDGSIDLRERQMVANVKAGDLIARKMRATAGTQGKNLRGETLEARDGVDIPLDAGEGVTVEKDGSAVSFLAAQDGVVSRKNNKITVHTILHIEGDVDFQTGNIDADQDVFVGGSVKSGFKVKAGGSIIVGGTLESGVEVRAHGDLTVGKGIIGASTKVVVLGNLRAQFVQNAWLMVSGDVWVGCYIHNAVVRCGGHLTVEEANYVRGGSVIGGVVSATKGIDVFQAGSPSTSATVLALKPNPEQAARIQVLEERREFCEQNIAKIMRTLGVKDFQADTLRRCLMRAPDAKRDLYVQIVKELGALAHENRETANVLAALVADAESEIEHAVIRIHRAVFSGVVIQVGEKEHKVVESTVDMTFSIVNGDLFHDPHSKKG